MARSITLTAETTPDCYILSDCPGETLDSTGRWPAPTVKGEVRLVDFVWFGMLIITTPTEISDDSSS